MNALPFTKSLLAPVLLTVVLAGCATAQSQDHKAHHPDTPAPADAKRSGMSPGAMSMMGSDMAAMCDMHVKIMSGNTPEERRALMAEHMKTMSPEMMKRHMVMMQGQMQMMQKEMGMMREHMDAQTPGK